jgi:hypothetical protein
MLALFAVVAALAFGTTASQAITNGRPDNGRHPYVGLMVALDANGIPLWRCSGSLLSPTVFLTAGHCTTTPADRVQVWFEQGPVEIDADYSAAAQAAAPDPVSCNASAAFDGYPCVGDVGGVPHTSPGFCSPCGHGAPNFASHDVGVVTLDSAVPTSLVPAYAGLPASGLVDTLGGNAPVDFVGYGVQFQAQVPGSQLPKPPPFNRWTGPRERMYAPSNVVPENSRTSGEFLKLALNPGGGSGGTCFGDSGGPDLLGGTSTVLGVNSHISNVNCSGVGYSQRVDVPDVRAWIASWL